jgi:hypothetical protein
VIEFDDGDVKAIVEGRLPARRGDVGGYRRAAKVGAACSEASALAIPVTDPSKMSVSFVVLNLQAPSCLNVQRSSRAMECCGST